MVGENNLDEQANQLIKSLYTDVKPDTLTVTSRNSDNYKHVLGLDREPVSSTARVLDVGGGNAKIKAEDFGLQVGNLVRIDMDPQQPDIRKGNILDLSSAEGEYDEVWAMFILKYVDKRLPMDVDQKIQETAEQAGIGWQKYALMKNMATFLGLKAIGEMLKITKPGGRIRIGSRIYDFKQSEALPSLLTAILSEKLPGIKISGTEVTSYYADDPEEREANLFLEKGEGFQNEDYSMFLRREYQRLIPKQFADSLVK